MLTDLETELLTYLRRRSGADEACGCDTDLIGTGLLDSLLLLDLVLHVEHVHGVALDAGDVTPANFRTLATLARLVGQRLESSARKAA